MNENKDLWGGKAPRPREQNTKYNFIVVCHCAKNKEQ